MNTAYDKFTRMKKALLLSCGTVAMALVAGAFPTSASAQDLTLKQFIMGEGAGVQADFYWPFENSYVSDLQTGATREKAKGYEVNGIYINDCDTAGSSSFVYEETDYFPILLDHMTRVGASSALIFGETTGDLAPGGGFDVNRYIELDFDTQMLGTFGMDAKKEWTMHMIVSPADSETGRGWETLFDIGDEDFMSGNVNKPIRITVDLQRLGEADPPLFEPATQYRVLIEAQGVARIAVATIEDTKTADVHGRLWHQIVVQYIKGSPSHIKLFANSVEDPTTSPPTVYTQEVITNSSAWRANTNGVARIGLDLENVNPFSGSIHNFAIWKSELSSSQINDLTDAFAHSATLTEYIPRARLTIDWDADLRFFMWNRPDTDALFANGSDRDLRNWNDPIWDREGVYPMVRVKNTRIIGPVAEPVPDLRLRTPAPNDIELTFSWDPVPGHTPADSSLRTADWTDYLNMGMNHYTTKSLADTNANSFMWQWWGDEAYLPASFDPPVAECYYIDDLSGRALLQNWRDVRAPWRNASSHPVITGSDSDKTRQFREVSSPFYREGLSANAFHSKDFFIALKNELNSRNLPIPLRLHFASEAITSLGTAWRGQYGSTYQEGWWEKGIIDSRADDLAYWAPPTVPASSYTTLSDLSDAHPDAMLYTPTEIANRDFTDDFFRFFRDQYDYGFGAGLLLPAFQELDPNVRMSEYGQIHAGGDPATEYFASKLHWGISDVSLAWADFSAPVLYPLTRYSIPAWDASNPGEGLLEDWGDRLGINHLLETDDLPDNGRTIPAGMTRAEYRAMLHRDINTIYVERAKHNINAAYLASGGWNGAPMSPWLPIPGYEYGDNKHITAFDYNGDGNNNASLDKMPVEWNKDDIARIAVFAYRRGAREFLVWGDKGQYGAASSSTSKKITEDIEYVFQAIEAVKNRSTDTTTTGAVAGDSNYGVPDGVVDIHDIWYFYTAYSTLFDLEGDFSGPNGRPDGVIDGADWNDYYAQYLIDSM